MKRIALLLILNAIACGALTVTGQAQTVFANLRADYATAGPLTDTFGTGSWSYYASDTPNPSAGSLTALTYQEIGNAHPGESSGYGASGHDGYSVPAVSNLSIFGDGASTSTDFLAWHPGNTSPTYTVLRWAAGAGETGPITLSGTFSRVGEPGGAVDVYIFVNDVQSYAETGVSAGTLFNYNFTAAILPGQTVDFVLGNGGNGYGGDESLISGTIASAVPEPATYAIFAGLGALGLAALRRRRRTA